MVGKLYCILNSCSLFYCENKTLFGQKYTIFKFCNGYFLINDSIYGLRKSNQNSQITISKIPVIRKSGFKNARKNSSLNLTK